LRFMNVAPLYPLANWMVAAGSALDCLTLE
jgi:hypothetical protein